MKKISLIAGILIISLLHYLSPIYYHQAHAVYQRLYYVPIILASYWFGLRTGLLFALLCGMSYAPHIFFQWSPHPQETFTQYVEIAMFFVIASLVGILSDIHRMQYRQIESAKEQIRRMDRLSLLGQLAAGLAHEIRNPLGSLIGSAEILKDSLEPDHPKHEFVEIMRKELNRLRDKLNEFLRFARPAPPQIVPNNINDVVWAAVKLVEKEASKSSITIATQFDDSSAITPMDAEQLKQVVLNLLLNAIHAMPEGGKITISTWKNSNAFGFSVEDEGTGIPDDQKERIFEPFFTTKKDGTGLGLAIVKQLIEAMKGTIDVTSSAKGSRFEVSIPHE